MRRRTVVAAALGTVAALAGTGAALWLERRHQDEPDIWNVRLPRPGGGHLAFADFRGHPLLLNFWATWCPPCVTEMPLLARFHRKRGTAGWQVVGVAVDQEQPVRAFIEAHAIGFPIALAGNQGLALSQALGNTAGGLPFSVVFDAAGRARDRKLGALDEATLERWARPDA
jgi:thiol-disulfide isomerase/thioredoxin